MQSVDFRCEPQNTTRTMTTTLRSNVGNKGWQVIWRDTRRVNAVGHADALAQLCRRAVAVFQRWS
eukprot:4463453-Pyramimonas_sp.AAC.1